MSSKKVIKVKRFETYLLEIYGYPTFREKQRDVIEAIVKQRVDVCCIMATGYGKSICYQLPAIIMRKPAIIISPLLSLMEDQRLNLEKKGVMACCYNSSVTNKIQLRNDILKGQYQVIYTTPETVVDLQDLLQSIHQKLGISVIAIDEAHCVSLWGNTFRSSYLQLSCLRDWLPKVPILALTGTATSKIEEDIVNLLKLSNPVKIRTGSDRPNLSYYAHIKNNPLSDLLPHVITHESTIIYCQTRKETEKLTEILRQTGISCEAYHAGLATELRNEIHHDFLTNKITCIIATISFGMGIDKKNIRKIIHYGCPKDIESYYQETGRGGRDGQLSQCHVYYSPSDFIINRSFLKDVHDPVMYKYKETMIAAIEKYLYTTTCRRQILLDYFDGGGTTGGTTGGTVGSPIAPSLSGEIMVPSPSSLGNSEKIGGSEGKGMFPCCDNCVSHEQLTTLEIGLEAQMFLELVHAFSGKLGKTKMIGVIRGSNSKDIPSWFKKHSNFGHGHDHSVDWWKTSVQYLINDGLIDEKIMSSGFGSILYISLKGMNWLNKNQHNPSFKITMLNQSHLFEKSNNQKMPSPPHSLPIPITTSTHTPQSNLEPQSNPEPIFIPKQINEKISKTQMITYDLFQNQDKSVKEIVALRNFTQRTIENHLAHCLEQGLPCDLQRLNVNEALSHDILMVINSDQIKGDLSKLAPIKALCAHNVSYAQIKYVVALQKLKTAKI